MTIFCPVNLNKTLLYNVLCVLFVAKQSKRNAENKGLAYFHQLPESNFIVLFALFNEIFYLFLIHTTKNVLLIMIR